MASAWVYQDDKQVKKHGPDKAGWYVGWFEPDGTRRGKSCGPGLQGKRNADKLRRKLEAELMTGTYQMHTRKAWPDFRREYTARIGAGLAPRSRTEVESALDHFERIVRPARVFALCTAHVDAFTAARRQEKGKKRGDLVSPTTVNKDLRHLKAALRVRMEKAPRKLPRYVTGDHFAAVYAACEAARLPAGLPYPAADWWRGLAVMGYKTGWRIGDMLGCGATTSTWTPARR